MAAPGDHTLAEKEEEEEDMEEMRDVVSDDEDDDDDDDEGVEMEEGDADEKDGAGKVYVPGMDTLQPGEELEMDRSAYRMYHECQTGECHVNGAAIIH